ncbi:hypothetical protein JCM16358_23200 [Halanaerocella petrolearia]
MGMESIYKLGVIVSAVDKLTGPVREMVGSVQNLEDNMNHAQKTIDLGQKMATTGAAVSGAAATMGFGLKSIIDPASQVKSELQKLKTVTTSTMGSIDKSLANTRKRAVEWSKAHTNSAQEYIRTTYMMASAGLKDQQAIAATETALTVAKATMADSAQTANLVATMYNNLGDKTANVTNEMGRLGDILTKTQQLFQLKNLGQLQEGLKYAIPSAKQFGTSVEELNVVLGKLNNAGMQGSMAGTAFASSMRKMMSASKKLGFEIARTADGGISYIGTLKNIKKQFGGFNKMSDETKMAFQKAFGAEGLRAISLLSGEVGDLQKKLKQVKNSKNAAAKAQKIMEAPPNEQWQILLNNLDALKMALSQQVSPTLSLTIMNVTTFIQKLTDIAKAHPTIAKTAMMIAGITTAILGIVGPIMTVMGAFTMMAGYGWKSFLHVKKGYLKLKGSLMDGKLNAALGKIKTGMVNMASAAKKAAISAAQNLKKMAISIYQTGKQAAITAATSMKKLAVSVWNFGKQAAMQAVNGLKSMALGLVQMAKKAVWAGVNAIPTLVASVWSFTTALLANPVTWVVVGIAALTAGIYALWKNWDKVVAFLQGAWNSTVSMVVSAFNWIQDTIDNTSNKALMVVSFFMPFIGLPALVIKNWSAIKTFFINLWGGIKNSTTSGIQFIKNAFIGFKNFLLTPIQLPKLSWSNFKTSLNDTLTWVKGLFTTFKKSGAGLWNAFTDGLKSVINKPKETVQAGLKKVRNLLPFSDAKEGPLSTLTKSGKALIDTLASGVNKSSGLTGMMKGVLGKASNFLKSSSLQLPELPALPNLSAKAQYVVENLTIPSLDNLKANAMYELTMPDIPSLPKLAGEAQYGTKTDSNFASSILGSDTGNISMPQFTDQQQQTESTSTTGSQIVIQGDVNLNVEEVNEPTDLVDALRKFKDEIGG